MKNTIIRTDRKRTNLSQLEGLITMMNEHQNENGLDYKIKDTNYEGKYILIDGLNKDSQREESTIYETLSEAGNELATIQNNRMVRNLNMEIETGRELTDKLRVENRSEFASVRVGDYELTQEVKRGHGRMELLNSKGEVLTTSKPQGRRSHALLDIMRELGLENGYGKC